MSAPLDRLIPIGEVALLLGFSCVATFRKHHRKALEARGFPKPLIGQCYDPMAIRAWRLQQMRPELRAVLEAAAASGPDPAGGIDWEQIARDNAERIAGDAAE